MRKITLSILVLLFGATLLTAQHLLLPYNLSFEEGGIGDEPISWEVNNKSKQQGYTFAISDAKKVKGRKSLKVTSPLTYSEDYFGSIFQSIIAKPYIGKTIRLTVAAMADVVMPDNYLVLWATVRDKENNIILTESNLEMPIFFNDWQNYEIEFPVYKDAHVINFGFMLKGIGTAYIDDVWLDFASADPKYNSPPHSISKSSINYLKSFAQIYGYIKFFYPNEYFDLIDWGHVGIAGVRLAEMSRSDDEFISNMEKLFQPIAPLMKLYKSGKPKFNFEKPKKEQPKSITWLHKGVASNHNTKISGSQLINIYESQREGAGLSIQANSVRVASYKNWDYEIKIRASASLENHWSFANLLVRFENIANRTIESASLPEPFIKSNKWETYKIKGKIPNDAISFRLAMNLYGEGAAYFDDITMSVTSQFGEKIDIHIVNSDFENNREDIIPGWTFPEATLQSGYFGGVIEDELNTVNNVFFLRSDRLKKLNLPNSENIFTIKLANKINFAIPTVLYADTTGLLPHNQSSIDLNLLGKPANFIANGKDRESRLAIIIDAWNYINHFHLYDVDKELIANSLPNFLERAAIEKDDDNFLKQLNELLTLLNDGQARVWKNSSDETYFLPILWRWIDGGLFVVKSKEDSGLKTGDLIIEINDEPTDAFLSKYERHISGSNQSWKRHRGLSELRAGKKGTKLKLKATRNGGKPFVVDLNRSIFADELIEQRPPRLTLLADDIVYCDMSRTKDNEFKDILNEVEKASGIIFDIRGLTFMSEHLLGLLSDKNLTSGSMFLNYYVLPYQSLKSRFDLSGSIRKINKLQSLKVVFLSDERSLGYSESILSIVKENKLAPIVGRPSAGNAGEVAGVRLPGGYMFSLSVIDAYSPSGVHLYGNGIEPDFPVHHSPYCYDTETDPIIQKAIDLINHSLSR